MAQSRHELGGSWQLDGGGGGVRSTRAATNFGHPHPEDPSYPSPPQLSSSSSSSRLPRDYDVHVVDSSNWSGLLFAAGTWPPKVEELDIGYQSFWLSRGVRCGDLLVGVGGIALHGLDAAALQSLLMRRPSHFRFRRSVEHYLAWVREELQEQGTLTMESQFAAAPRAATTTSGFGLARSGMSRRPVEAEVLDTVFGRQKEQNTLLRMRALERRVALLEEEESQSMRPPYARSQLGAGSFGLWPSPMVSPPWLQQEPVLRTPAAKATEPHSVGGPRGSTSAGGGGGGGTSSLGEPARSTKKRASSSSSIRRRTTAAAAPGKSGRSPPLPPPAHPPPPTDSEDINAVDARGQTALHRAALRGDEAECSTILWRPDFIAVSVADMYGRTAMDYAREKHLDAVCESIVAHPSYTPDDDKGGRAGDEKQQVKTTGPVSSQVGRWQGVDRQEHMGDDVDSIGESVVVTVVGASSLQPRSSGNLPDPYCVCSIVSKPESEFRTESIEDSLKPVWNDTRKIRCYAVGDDLSFTLYDDKAMRKDAKLGSAVLKNADFHHPDGFEGELHLGDKSGKDRTRQQQHPILIVRVIVPALAADKTGQTAAMELARAGNARKCLDILRRAHYTGANEVDDLGKTVLHYAAEAGLADVCAMVVARKDFKHLELQDCFGLTALALARERDHQSVVQVLQSVSSSERKIFDAFTLQIHIVSAEDLPALHHSSANPYCECSILGKESQSRFETKTVKGTVAPQWRETHELRGFQQGERLDFVVYNNRHLAKDEVLGRGMLFGTQFLSKEGFAGRVHLFDCGDGHEATLNLKVAVPALRGHDHPP